MGMSGVAGVLKNGDGPTIALRFDIDALGLIEENSLSHFPYKNGFSSVHLGQCTLVVMMDILRLDLQQQEF